MSNDLVIFEQQLQPLIPQFADVLAGRMPPERLIRTVCISVERTPKLLQCNRQSLLNAAMTFGVLALEVDGVTGQGYILPFKDRAQPIIGYKGFSTLGARAGLTITGEVVREGDEFDYQLGTRAFVHHKPSLSSGRRIIAAWAQAESRERPPIISIMGLDDLEAVRRKSPGARKEDSPWNDVPVGLPAMYAKTVKRRLSRSTPLVFEAPEFLQAARMEEAFDEQGRHAYISPTRGVVVEGDRSPLPARQDAVSTPVLSDLTGQKPDAEIEALKRELLDAAEGGMSVVAALWDRIGKKSPRLQHALREFKDQTIKPLAERADRGELT